MYNKQLREILNCQCAFNEEYNGKAYNLKTEEYEDCSCVEQIKDLLTLFDSQLKAGKRELLYDLDEIENKPWRVFRQLAEIMPEYADTYGRYEKFYAYGGGNTVMKLIEDFEKAQKAEESIIKEKKDSV